ncbi:PAS domain-containing protein [Photorhabdus aegyptia]|uniref:ATP-dependent transcriptional regulator n=1 Tax=Photorhabdus aegyptia TaxID=2805098 RepID=A0A022PCJ6_9GAMM|nr:PAS domain-containing protein [Photorhabdus aegyptia]EYU13426.1 ATP-dependent transcriptional regulator [Photorhabdus aegyptia]
MPNKRKMPNIAPQLINMWKKSNEPWGAKDCQSRFIYANPAFYQLLNLPEDFDIIGYSMGELPSPIAEYAEEFHHQEQKAIRTMQRVTSLEAHQFGESNVKQTYICDKFPLFDENNDCIGIFFHMYKTQDFSVSYYYERTSPSILEFIPPNNILTQTEWEVLFLTLRTQDEENIGKELMMSTEDVVDHIQSIYHKFNLPLHTELSDFCKKNSYHLYIPERFVTIGSKEL